MKRYVLLFSLIVFYADVFPQAVEAGVGRGDVLKIDSWLINDALKQQEANTYWIGYNYQTHAGEACDYAADYNYPSFTFGLLVADFNRVRLRYNPSGNQSI